MKKFSRLFLLGALTLVLLTAACGGEEGTATPIGTSPGATSYPPPFDTETPAITETEMTSTEATTETPTAAVDLTGTAVTNTTETAATGTTQTPGIPVTGSNILLLECQFCVDTIAHALLVIPETATFE